MKMKIAMMIGMVCMVVLACGVWVRMREAEKQLSIAEERLAASYENTAATAAATVTAMPAPTATDRYECNMKIAAAILMAEMDPVYVIGGREKFPEEFAGLRDRSTAALMMRVPVDRIWRNPERFPEKFADLRDRWSSEDPLLVEWADAALPLIDKWRNASSIIVWDTKVLVEEIRSGEC